MIKYNLICEQGCEFEAWFRCSHTFDVQEAARQIDCPHCGSNDVQKSRRTSKVTTSKSEQQQRRDVFPSTAEATEAEIADVLRRFRAQVKARSEDVAREFSAEARDLIEEEVAGVRLPRLPKDSD